MKPPFTVLGTYVLRPGMGYASKIGPALVAFTKGLGMVPLKDDDIQRNEYAIWTSYKDHAEVRIYAEPQSEGTGWHQDGDTTVGHGRMDFGLIVWADHTPTEFRTKDGVFQPKPYEVVYAHNLSCTHRRPPGMDCYRWHFRQRVVKRGLS